MFGAPVTPAIDAEMTTAPPLPAAIIAVDTADSTVNTPTTLTSRSWRTSSIG